MSTSEAFVSTGSLPGSERVRALVEEAHARFAPEARGKVAGYIPVLADADPGKFGICIANTRGDDFAIGDAEDAFSIQSVSKPFVFAFVCDALGAEEVERLLG